jgi:glycosyltransferase involved in cell wall biosynthesis
MPHIMNQEYPNYEVVIIDQSSDNVSEERIKSSYGHDPRLRYIRPGTAGLSIARNNALAEARHDICAFTDDDVEVPRNWLSKIASTFDAYPDTDVLFGPVHVPPQGRGKKDEYYACLYFEEARVLNKGEIFGMGANMTLRKSFFEKVGPFDAFLGPGALLPGSDEHDWLYRAHVARGVIRLDPHNPIDHRAARTFDQWLKLTYLYAYGDAAFATKHLRCGDLQMVYRLSHRLLYKLAKACQLSIQRDKHRAFDKTYLRRYWLGIWGSLKYPIDRKTRLYVAPDQSTHVSPRRTPRLS